MPYSTLASRIAQRYPKPLEQTLGQLMTLIHHGLQFESALDKTLARYFRSQPQIGSRQRRIISQAVTTVIRHQRQFNEWIKIARSELLRGYAILGLAYSDAWPQEHALKPLPFATAPQIRYSVPDWLYQQLAQDDAAQASLAWPSLLENAPLDLRVNSIKAQRNAILTQLQQEPLWHAHQPVAHRYSEFGIRLAHSAALQQHSLFQSGQVEIQDEGSQLIAQLLAPKRGEIVLDFCAGAGGKTLALGALMKNSGILYACDIHDKRLAQMKPRLARSGLSNVHPIHLSSENDTRLKRLRQKCHRVLVDAPCSGLGTLRRNPDLKWRQSPDNIVELAQLQGTILRAAAKLVRAEGYLLYATCSILQAENADVVAAFLAEQPDYQIVDLRSWCDARGLNNNAWPYLQLTPWQHQTDGFFCALLQRKAASIEPLDTPPIKPQQKIITPTDALD